MSVLAVPLLMLFAALPVNSSDNVRIGLFTLFRPHTVQVRIAGGERALLDATSISTRIETNQLINITVAGNHLKVDVQGSHTMRQSEITGSIRVTPDDSAALELILPGKLKRTVRGTVSIDNGISGRGPLRIVVTTRGESAVASIVAAETSEREPQALQALAVVVRTFMVSHPSRHSSEGFDFCDTTHCQLYRGEQDLSDQVVSSTVESSVAHTFGQVLRFEGAPLEGYYTAACGGITATPSMVWGGHTRYPYTRVSCEWCQRSRFKRWERSADRNRILESLSAFTESKLSSATELIT